MGGRVTVRALAGESGRQLQGVRGESYVVLKNGRVVLSGAKDKGRVVFCRGKT